MKTGVSKVYTDRPDYADFDSPAKFEAIKSIIAKRLREHPNAICSYSGGADSDIMIDLIERTRRIFELPPIKYVFFNTGLEMKATKDHVKEQAICALRLQHPVMFCRMDDPDVQVEVKYVLNLALLDDSEHVEIIARVIRYLKDDNALKEMDAASLTELETLLKEKFLTDGGEN